MDYQPKTIKCLEENLCDFGVRQRLLGNIIQSKTNGSNIFKKFSVRECKPMTLYAARLSFKY